MEPELDEQHALLGGEHRLEAVELRQTLIEMRLLHPLEAALIDGLGIPVAEQDADLALAGSARQKRHRRGRWRSSSVG